MFWERFYKLCKNRGTSPNTIAAELRISSGSVTEWKKGRMPRFSTAKKIADYFGVTVDYLLSDDSELLSDKSEPPATTKENRAEANTSKSNVIFLDTKNIYLIPLFESVSAGLGSYADSDVIDYVPLYIANAAEAEETMCIRVCGDSMYPKIEEGDIIQVHKQDSVDSGTLAVVLLDKEEGLVKRVEYGLNWIELHSINPMYKPMRFTGPDVQRIQVVGTVKKIIKSV